MPDLSVVIPTFDTAAMTLRCCRAVLASMAPSTEVIVVDDGSRDGTADLLARETPSVRVVRLESNGGFARAANRGVAVASGRIVVLLNSDTVVERDALRALVAAFDDERTGIAGAQLLDEDGTPQWSGGPTPTLVWMAAVVSGAGRILGRKKTAKEVDWVSGAAMAFRSEVWREAGPLSERFRFYCQDLDFCMRARDAGWRVRLVPEARVLHGLGRTIAADNPLRHDPERLWPDLLDWGAARYGRAWARLARFVLVIAATFRIALQPRNASLRRAACTLVQSDA